MAVGAEAAAAMIAEREGDGSAPPLFYPPAPPAPGVWQATPELQPGGRRVPARARHDAVRARERRPVPPGTAPVVLQLPVGARLHRGRRRSAASTARSARRTGPTSRASTGRARRADLEPRHAPGRRGGAQVADLQRARVRAAQHGDHGRPHRRDGHEVHLHLLAPRDRDPAGHTDGNPFTLPDPAWPPFITVPCHPSYPSAHATLAGGAREVSERLFGQSGHSITLSSALVPGVVLHYTRFKDIARDIDDARIYGGVHYRFDQRAGAELGIKIGQFIIKRNLPAEPQSPARLLLLTGKAIRIARVGPAAHRRRKRPITSLCRGPALIKTTPAGITVR